MAGTTSGFADGRHEVSPDSEQMEQTATVLLLRNSGSVERIQDKREKPSRSKTKKEPSKGSFIMAGLTLQGSNSLRNFTNILTIPLLPERYAISYLHSKW